MRNNTIKSTVLCLLALLTFASVMGQQDPNRAFYRYTMNLVNPAYAGAGIGLEGSSVPQSSEVGLNIRSQWVSVEGAPESQSVFFGTPMGNNLGLGVSIVNDQTFIENSTSLNIDVSYRLQISAFFELYLGVKAGANSYDANLSGLMTFGIGSDPSLSNIDGSFKPNVGAGALLKGERFFASLSVPAILSNDRLERENGIATYAAGKAHVYLAGGYDFELSKSILFKPSTMFRYVEASPLSIDITAAFSFNNRVEVGPTYRYDEGIGGLFIFNASNWINMGYAYETPYDNEISSQSNGTHEVFIKLIM
ncbi:PorP/SprF family type IX secretion system membrane protein [Maribacter litoralis]|uniref:PorP/SprF family type IX secretion system membrane protein n=1 Tax=Maribacter litoralis TaxID=2059726 RepID=UPI003D2D5032